jgi:endonuclease/exonuclease/phosphatase family metal-dependent hydrolase
MTYNVRYQHPDDDRHRWEGRKERVATTIRFHRPDIVGLQEGFPTQLADLRDLLPAFEWLDAGRPDGTVPGEYTPIGFRTERFSVEDDGSFYLSETPDDPGRGWDAALPRLARYARFRDVETETTFVHCNTHFDHRGETARSRSADLILDRLAAIQPDGPVVLSGDLNCRPGSDPYRRLTGEEDGPTLSDAADVADTPVHGPTTSMTDFSNLIPAKMIDHVLVSAGIAVRQHGRCSDTYDDGRYPSDHLPVVADLVLPGEN